MSTLLSKGTRVRRGIEGERYSKSFLDQEWSNTLRSPCPWQCPPCQCVWGPSLSLLCGCNCPSWGLVPGSPTACTVAPWPLGSLSVTLFCVGLEPWVTFSFSGLFLWDVKLALCHAREVCTHGGSPADGVTLLRDLNLTIFHSLVHLCRKIVVPTNFKHPRKWGRRCQWKKNKNCSFWKLRKPGKAQILLFANSGNPKRFWNVAGRFLLLPRKLCQV